MSNEAVVADSSQKTKGHPVAVVLGMLALWLAATFAAERISGGVSSWHAPSTADFEFPGWFHTSWFTKPMLLALVAFVSLAIYWVIASRRLKIMPSKPQFLAELVYKFVSGVGRDMIGPGHRRFTPYLLTIFSFILVNNWFGELFVFMFPTFSRIGYAYAGALLTMLVYVVAGFMKHGLGYLRVALAPPGVPLALYPIIIPLEFLSVFITRPLTLSIRLFANMFAGHMAIMVFVGGGAALLGWLHNVMYNVAGVFGLILGVAMLCLELLIGFLQAFIFTLLTAQYIGSSVGEGH